MPLKTDARLLQARLVILQNASKPRGFAYFARKRLEVTRKNGTSWTLV